MATAGFLKFLILLAVRSIVACRLLDCRALLSCYEAQNETQQIIITIIIIINAQATWRVGDEEC